MLAAFLALLFLVKGGIMEAALVHEVNIGTAVEQFSDIESDTYADDQSQHAFDCNNQHCVNCFAMTPQIPAAVDFSLPSK